MRVLVLRSQPNAARTAVALRAAGHQAIVAPLFEIETISPVDFGAGPWAAFLLTSANAASALAAQSHRDEVRNVPVLTVGERTAQAIRDAGFTAITSAGGNVIDLANLVAMRLKPPARLLYLAGEDRSGDLAGDLRAKGFAVDTAIVYRVIAATNLPPAAAAALADGIDGVLHFSRRSAETYVGAARAAGALASALNPVHFCLSTRVAEPLTQAGAAITRIAERPTEAALIALIDAA